MLPTPRIGLALIYVLHVVNMCSPCVMTMFSLSHGYALPGPLLPTDEFLKWTLFEAVLPFFSLWRCVRGQNRGNWTCRIPKRCFQLFSTPSSGQKWQKTRIFRVLLNRKSPRHLGDGLWKQKMFVYDIKTFFVFTAKIFLFKNFSRRPSDLKTR